MSDAEDISAEELRSMAAEIASSFPPPRAGTEIVLLQVNPHRAHAFWNIDLEEARRVDRETGGLPLVVRLHDVTGIDFDGTNPHDTHDTIVSGLQGQTDLNVWKDGRTYLAELGYRRADGFLIHLATSEPVDMPRKPTLAAMATAVPPSTAAVEAGLEMAGLLATGEAARAVASPPSPARPVEPWPDAEELASLLPPRAERVVALYDRAATEDSAISAAQQAMAVQILMVPECLPAMPPTLVETLRKELVPEETAAPRETPASLAVATPAPVVAAGAQPIRLEDYLSYSSHGLGRAEPDVRIEVDLLVHGSVPPGRTATLFGRPVPVDASGRFALRQPVALPGPLLPYIFPPAQPGA